MARHYGLKLEDRVEMKAFGGTVTGTVIHLYALDNNGARIRLDDGREMDVVCEWCEMLPKKERCPDCGQAVYSFFDHVDRDQFCNPNDDGAGA